MLIFGILIHFSSWMCESQHAKRNHDENTLDVSDGIPSGRTEGGNGVIKDTNAWGALVR